MVPRSYRSKDYRHQSLPLIGLGLLLVLLAVCARAQFSGVHQPMFGNSQTAQLEIGLQAYEYWSFNDSANSGTNLVVGSYSRMNFNSNSVLPIYHASGGVNGGYVTFDGNVSMGLAAPTINTNFSQWGTSSWSMSMWINVTNESLAGGGLSGGATVAGIWRNGGGVAAPFGPARFWKVGYETNGFLMFRVKLGGTYDNSVSWATLPIWRTNMPQTNQWIHLAFGFDLGNTNIWFQTNAGPRQVQMLTNGVAPYEIAGDAAFLVGNITDGSRAFYGDMDEIGYWKRALSTSEVTTLYGGGTPLVYSADWMNDYVYPPVHPELFDPRVLPYPLVTEIDALKPETFFGNAMIAPPTGTPITNAYSNLGTNIFYRKDSITSGGGRPVWHAGGAGTNGTKPRIHFDGTAHLSHRSANTGNGGSWTNFTMVIVMNILSALPGGSPINSDRYVDFQETMSAGMGQSGNPGLALINWSVGDAFCCPGPQTIPTNILVYTYMVSNNIATIYTNGAVYQSRTADVQDNGQYIPVSLGGLINGSGGLTGGFRFDLCRFWAFGAALNVSDRILAENGCRRDYELP